MTRRDKIVKRLEEWNQMGGGYRFKPTSEQIADEILALDNWVSVEDDLPKGGTEVEIAYWDGTCMCRTFGAHITGTWYEFEDEILKVTHWREATPLPEPPKD